ncbi:hypothetical protein FZEAL_4509 [Fusarium zealandicum]|uniref:LrgB-like protein n=1 Tax=Fusarium zealandicum TaxID=1053134 RepID=A0A8H4XLU7_9HYPO|nr:hypothetical protein FZEAL_4509 [Fusarium zealandicum]
MAVFKNTVSEILRRCLRHSNEALDPFLSWIKMLFHTSRDMSNTAVLSTLWARRLTAVLRRMLEFGWVVVVYLASELIIWGLSRALALVGLQFFSSIFGMVLTFGLMTAAYITSPSVDNVYQRHIKSKVRYAGRSPFCEKSLGFPIPLVMLNQSDILGGHDIACIIGNFVVTNLTSWVMVFAASLLVMALAANTTSQIPHDFCTPRPLTATPPRVEISWLSDSTLDQIIQPLNGHRQKSVGCSTPGPETGHSSAVSRRSSTDVIREETVDDSFVWRFWTSNFPLMASFLGIFLIGAPIAAAANEDRVLDGCVLWFVWALTLHVQRQFKTSRCCDCIPKIKSALVTLMNPVLFTTLLMTAYTRGKAGAYGAGSLSRVLSAFSSGTPLYALWTSIVTNGSLPKGQTSWFGAGDAALSILECGILIWGFKLYECQRQLFSVAGLLTVLVAAAAAAGNVFLSVLAGNKLGLDAPEALAFAARSTTLALAKPAMTALGGNLGVNAALVVSNGILGQLCYPFALDKLGIKQEDGMGSSHQGECQSELEVKESSFQSLTPILRTAQQKLASGDDPVTIATGITIGINGAAMGVSYLYETKSRAAPYAALAMTVSGVMTVVFTTVEPFKDFVISLAT